MPLPHRPWANTFWLPGGQVLCGEYPSDLNPSKAKAELQALAEFGSTTFIDLTTSDDNLRPYEPLDALVAQEHWPDAGCVGTARRTKRRLPFSPSDGARSRRSNESPSFLKLRSRGSSSETGANLVAAAPGSIPTSENDSCAARFSAAPLATRFVRPWSS
jgi:hypothetical protein